MVGMCIGTPQCVGLRQHMVGTYHQRVFHTLAVPSGVLYVRVVGRLDVVQTIIIFRIQAVVGLKEEGVRHGAVHALQPACQKTVAHQGRVGGIFAIGIVECREVEGCGEAVGTTAVLLGLLPISLCDRVGGGIRAFSYQCVEAHPVVRRLRNDRQCCPCEEYAKDTFFHGL